MQLSFNLQFRDNLLIIDDTKICSELYPQINNIPDPEQELMYGIKWGCFSQLFTPAYWKVQYLMHNQKDGTIQYRLGENLLEEITACLLGGFGFKSELGTLAFDRLKNRGLIKEGSSHNKILNCLTEPFTFNSKEIHYRFPNQKSKFIYEFLNRKDLELIPRYNDIELRNWLLTVNGIGSKTASWITRNYLDSENVAIIDIHIFRACQIMGLFTKNFDIQKDYDKLEQIFLGFCRKLDVLPSKMDTLIWLQMKQSNRLILKGYY
jgi:thermostable 8-oxoguanine DNA glycosylase